MKKILLKILLCVLFSCSILFCLTACNNGQPSIKGTEIYSETLTVDNQAKTIYGKLPNGTEIFEVSKNIRVADGATYHLCSDILGQNVIVSKTATLKTGDNTYYLIVENNNEIETYNLTLRVRPLYKVSFDIQTEYFVEKNKTEQNTAVGGSGIIIGGSSSSSSSGIGYVESQYVEEDSFAVVPENPTRLGCEFTEWDFDFSQKITKDTTIKAKWKKNKEMENFQFESDGGFCRITAIINKEITHLDIPDYVTLFSTNDFSSCNSLTRVNYAGTIDQWVQIKFGAFGNNCNPLTYAKNLYINDELVTDAVITKATSVSNYAFYNCSALTSVTIGNSVTSIGEKAFYNCSNLKEINFNAINCADLTDSSYAFDKAGQNGNGINVNFGNAVTKIPAYLFYRYYSNSYAPKITSVTIGDNVKSIGNYAFYDCSGLTSVKIPNSVTKIGKSAFINCSNLTSIIIGEGVLDIDCYAFRNCSSLASIVIPKSVISIGNYVFSGCSSLDSITFKEQLTWFKTDSYTKWQDRDRGTYVPVFDTSIDIVKEFTGIATSAYYWYRK